MDFVFTKRTVCCALLAFAIVAGAVAGVTTLAAVEPNPDRRMRLLEEAEVILVEQDLPILPLCTYVTLYMYEPGRLTGLTKHPRLDQNPRRWAIRP